MTDKIGWEEQFNQRFSPGHDRIPYYILEDDAIDFISSLLKAKEEELVGKIKEEMIKSKKKGFKLASKMNYRGGALYTLGEETGFDKAINLIKQTMAK